MLSERECCFSRRKLCNEEEIADPLGFAELLAFWDQLNRVTCLRFSVLFSPQNKWQVGEADVVIERPSPEILIFQERGLWITGESTSSVFTNSFRFILDLQGGSIALEHLRYGEKRPVLLFQLTAVSTGVLESANPHVCGQDIYLARMFVSAGGVDMECLVEGPKKHMQLMYQYKTAIKRFKNESVEE